ncbi:MAG: hypothetical protein AAGJ82_04085 [Bacteroidota bacterium]
MRILGYLERPGLKITVFKMDMRLSIKFENGALEQTYKFRVSEHLNTLAAINELVDEAFLQSVQERFVLMQRDFGTALEKRIPPRGEEALPQII